MKPFLVFLAIVLLVGLFCIFPANAFVMGFNATVDGYTDRTAANMTMTEVVGAGTGANTVGTTMVSKLETFPGTTTDHFHVGSKIIWSANTAPIPDGATITDVRFNYTIFLNNSGMKPFQMTITNGSLTTEGAIVAGDYARNGSTEYISRVLWSDTNLAQGTTQRSVQFNAAGIAGINKTGNTTLFIQISDLQDTAFTGVWDTDPVTGENNTIQMRSNDHATAAYRPVLNITYTLPSTKTYPTNITDTYILPNSDTALPSEGMTLNVSATAGEITHGYFVIKAPLAATDMSVNASAMTNETGGTIPASALNITTVVSWWQSPNNATSSNYVLVGLGTNWRLTPELKVCNRSLVRADWTAQTNDLWVENATFTGYVPIDNRSINGWVKDYKIIDDCSANGYPIPFSMTKDENAIVSIRFKVPDNTPPGNYSVKLGVNSSESNPTMFNATLWVLPFELENNTYTCHYYGTDSLDATLGDNYIAHRNLVSEANYTVMLQNLKDHGCSPVVETGTDGYAAGTETMLDLIDAMDFPKTDLFYSGYGWGTGSSNLSNAQMTAAVNEVTAAVASARTTHGYTGNIYFLGRDEPTLEEMIYAKPLYENITANGGSVYGAITNNVSYLIDYLNPVSTNASASSYPYVTSVDGSWLDIANRNISHAAGKKVWVYYNPQVGIEYPQTYRRNFGLLLAKWGFDGGFDYQWYRHQPTNSSTTDKNTTWNEYHRATGTAGGWYKPGGMVYPKYGGYINTLQYDEDGEGKVDQQYYLTLAHYNPQMANDTITAGISDGSTMQAVRANLTRLILTESATPTVAGFSGTPISGTAPVTVTFTDASTYLPVSWKWAYKNATVGWTAFPTNSTAQNPVTTFPAGVYDINLTATNAVGSDDEIKTAYLAFLPPPTVASFTANDTSLCMGDYVKFTDTSTNYPNSWIWQYGDGNTSTLQSPTFQYNVAGTFDVDHWANNTGGGSWDNDTAMLTVYSCTAPTFTPSRTIARWPGNTTIDFTDTSTNSPTAWNWYFSDGTANVTTQNAAHTYRQRGSFPACLITTTPAGKFTGCQTIRILIGDTN